MKLIRFVLKSVYIYMLFGLGAFLADKDMFLNQVQSAFSAFVSFCGYAEKILINLGDVL